MQISLLKRLTARIRRLHDAMMSFHFMVAEEAHISLTEVNFSQSSTYSN